MVEHISKLGKTIFSGKQKIVTIPLAIVLAFFTWPFIIGIGLTYLSFAKTNKKVVRFVLVAISSIFFLPLGIIWTQAASEVMFSNSDSTTNHVKVTSNTSKQTNPTPNSSSIPTPKPTPTPTPSPSPSPSPTPDPNLVQVVKVIDGDTIVVSLNGKNKTIRIIGINAPETYTNKSQCFGPEATKIAKEKLNNTTVQLESDPSQGERDKYQRLLRYVWMENGATDFGKFMIANGYAKEYTYNTPYKYQKEYQQAEQEAKKQQKGLWSPNACPPSPTPTPTPKPTPTPITNQTTTSSCKYSCTGPDRDCSDFATQAEAQAFFNCCGFTATYDPMRLDGVGIDDGIPCESLP